MAGARNAAPAKVPTSARNDRHFKYQLEFDTYYGTHCLYCAHFALDTASCHYLAHLRGLFRTSARNAECPRYRPRVPEPPESH